jgi:ATP-dependent protease ClpP protease subunit
MNAATSLDGLDRLLERRIIILGEEVSDERVNRLVAQLLLSSRCSSAIHSTLRDR